MQEKNIEDAIIGFSERLVELVSKNKILYDSTSEGYSNFKAQDEIWRKIANELNEDVSACKLKWKNIRSCYTRYLRQISLQNRKIRSYYLAERLKFLLPFSRPNARQPVDPVPLDEISNPALQFENGELELNRICKSEPTDEQETSSKAEPDVSLDESNSEQFSEEVNSNNKRQVWDTSSEFEFTKKSKISECDVAELDFFRSLLPDIRQMSRKQKNKLKIAILGTINDILYSDDS